MKCMCCNRLIIPKIKIINLFKRSTDLLCDYCYKRLNISIDLSILPINNGVFYAFRLSNNNVYIKDIFYSKDIYNIYNLANKLFNDYTLLHFDNEKKFLNTIDIIDEITDILNKIIVIYH